MNRIAVVMVGAALCGCRSLEPSNSADAGGRRTAKAQAEETAGGRFYARGPSGDDHELKLHRLTVDVTTRPGTVRSHLTMEIATAVEGQSEAIIRMPVPRGAAVTDAVLWVDDRPMRGAFVERQRARDIYTSIVTRRRDPALITWDGPGWIGVSIYPLANNKPRRFELEWVEPAAVTDGRIQYRVPAVSDGNRVVGRASVTADGRRLASSGRDLVALAPADPHKVFTRRAPGDPFQQVMVREAGPTGAPHFVLVAETSAAMSGADRRRQRVMIDQLLSELPPGAKMTLLAADWDVSAIIEEADASGWAGALGKLDAVPSAGALHLERVLREAAARAGKAGAAAVLFVGRGEDGFEGDAVSRPLADLRAAHIRLSFADTGSGDPSRPLASTAIETGGEVFAARAFDESLTLLVDALQPRPSLPALDAGAGEWHVLRTVTGGAVWIGRALGADAVPDAETARAEAGSALATDLASLWDRARLEWHDKDVGEEIAQVLTPVTSLLVLETNDDYRRFGVAVPDPVTTGKMSKATTAGREGLYGLRGPAENPDPTVVGRLPRERARNTGTLDALRSAEEQQALARNIQAVENSHVASIFGRDTALSGNAEDVLGHLIGGNQIGQAYGVGGLGVVGTGSGGGGTGEHTIGAGNLGTIGKYGRDGLAGKRAKVPDVALSQVSVHGQLDKEIIRRIIHRHINEIRYCYEQELTRFPGLGGRVMVQFTIAGTGQVIASVLQNSTLANARVESCVVQAVKRWEFPAPVGGGLAIVSYPFVLTPNGGAGMEQAAGPGQPMEVMAHPIVQALSTLTESSDAAHIERISSLLGLRRTSSAEVLAWTIDRRDGEPFERRLLVARLLEATKHHRDAVRVLTEWARTAPESIAAELRSLKADDDAAEVLALAKRAR